MSATALVSATSTANRDPRSTALERAVPSLPRPVVELCLAYAHSQTFFDSVAELLAHFRAHDELVIAAGESLEIRDMSVLFRLQSEDPDLLPSNAVHKCLFVLNKILALVGKRGFFRERDYNITVTLTEEFLAFQFDRPVTLQTQKAPIAIRPKHLFQMMCEYSVDEIHFAPNQALVFVGLTEEQQRLEAKPGDNFRKWEGFAPPGCAINWTINLGKLGGLFFKKVVIDTRCAEGTRSQRGFFIRAEHSMRLFIERPLALIPADTFAVAMPNRLSDLPVIRITENLFLREDFTFNDPNAVLIIERNLIGPGRKVSIVARNVIMSPHATIQVGRLDVQTTGASLLLNVQADRLRLVTGRDAVVANSHARNLLVQTLKNANVFGLNWSHQINLRDHLDPIFRVLRDVSSAALPFLLPAPQRSLALLEAPADDADAAAAAKK